MKEIIQNFMLVEIATILLSLSATSIAVMVYLFNKKTFRAGALKATHSMWHAYHSILLQDKNMDLAMRIIEHNVNMDSDAYKSRQLLVMLLNILYYEWSLSEQNLIDKKYASESFEKVIQQIKLSKDELLMLMAPAGFDPRFIDLVANNLIESVVESAEAVSQDNHEQPPNE